MSITVVCAVMNRFDVLRVSLMSWLKFREISRIIVVDWSSSDFSDDFIKFVCLLDNRIEFKRVDTKDIFHMAGAYNLAVSMVDTEFVLKLDADIILNPYFNFFDIHKLGAGEFITGDWQWGSLDNQLGFLKYLNGFLYIKTNDFRAIGGYDERYVNYSYEDTDLYDRLARYGFTHRLLDVHKLSVYHNPHNDDMRVMNFVEKDIKRSLLRNCDMFKSNRSIVL
jgi:hypothetical protein